MQTLQQLKKMTDIAKSIAQLKEMGATNRDRTRQVEAAEQVSQTRESELRFREQDIRFRVRDLETRLEVIRRVFADEAKALDQRATEVGAKNAELDRRELDVMYVEFDLDEQELEIFELEGAVTQSLSSTEPREDVPDEENTPPDDDDPWSGATQLETGFNRHTPPDLLVTPESLPLPQEDPLTLPGASGEQETAPEMEETTLSEEVPREGASASEAENLIRILEEIRRVNETPIHLSKQVSQSATTDQQTTPLSRAVPSVPSDKVRRVALIVYLIFVITVHTVFIVRGFLRSTCPNQDVWQIAKRYVTHIVKGGQDDFTCEKNDN